MKYLTLETYSGSFPVSKIAFGTGSAMWRLSKEEYFRLFDLYVQAGGNCLDTAPGYNHGISEAYIGEWMKARRNRASILLSTKACHTSEGQPSRLSRKDMEDDIHQSLCAMQIDCVDMLWIHKDDPDWPVEDVIDNINAVVKAGKVRAVGCSNWAVERIEKANRYAREHGLHGFVASQVQWSLGRVESEAYKKRYGVLVMDDPSFVWYQKNQMPIFAFSALAQGFFARAAVGGVEALSAEKRAYFETPDNLKRLEKVKVYMKEHNVPSSVPVLGYLLNNKLPCVALISASTPAMLTEALAAADTDLSISEVDALFACG